MKSYPAQIYCQLFWKFSRDAREGEKKSEIESNFASTFVLAAAVIIHCERLCTSAVHIIFMQIEKDYHLTFMKL